MQNQLILTPYFLDDLILGLYPLAQPDWRLNQPTLSFGERQQRMQVLYQPLADFVAETVACGDRPVSIAGDCCTTLGVLAGLQRAGVKPTLIWLDAHGDFNTWETTPSNFLGGMPLAWLVGRGRQAIGESLGLAPLPESDVILTDARDLDPGEQEAVAESEVVHLTNVADLLDYDLGEAPLYVHFDTDIIDSNDAPAMNYPTPNGPTLATLQQVFQHLAQTKRVIAVSMSTWNPELDSDGRSRQLCMNLLSLLLAQ